MQPSLFENPPWTVTALTRYLRALLENDGMLQDVWVEGEISNLSRPASGHIYFTLKDAAAALRCVMWRSDVLRNRLTLQDGMAVEIHGRIGIYEPAGQYQLYVDRIRPLGEGALFQEFLRLKALLEAEGLFDAARKRPIPALPRRIGIVTSASGAAIRDMLNTLRRRLPLVEVILAPSLVQGEEAPLALVEALTALARQQPDVILLARGGGSIEDLWAFNDERVVRAVAASPVPIICGVGHETDFTLCDFAADLRAPTPTAAAELATQITLQDLFASLQTLEKRLLTATAERLRTEHSTLQALQTRLHFHSPRRRLESERQRLDDLSRRASWAILQRLRLQNARLDGLNRRLQALNPLAVLRRGYALLRRKEDGGLVSRVAQASAEMIVRLSDGEFEVRKI
jgi:exodeoxyribonuclease VII large subunit